ncbi:MAG: addiction module protein [Planctomycetaceae bacterium]|nr:addiction module protein [Planctomycetaceae bacterium]
MATRDELAQQVLALSQDDRAFLADLLDQSLVEEGGMSPEELAAVWTVEIDRRIAAYEAGESGAVDAETAMKEMREKLAEHRNRISQ